MDQTADIKIPRPEPLRPHPELQKIVLGAKATVPYVSSEILVLNKYLSA